MSPFEPAQEEVVRPSSPDGPEAHAFLRGLIDGLRCGVLSIDAGGRVRLINEHARRILELRRSPEIGSLLWQALPRHPRIVQALQSSFAMASLPNRAEMEHDHGGKRIGFTLSLVRAECGAACGAAMFFKDLTPIEQREEQERLKDRLVALGQMAASMAHEIRNPLASIEVSCKLLERRLVDTPECGDLLAKIVSEVKRLNRSVDSCLEYVRPVSLGLSVEELGPMLEEAVDVAERRRGRPGIRIERRIERGIPPFLMDRTLLRQVFVNLVLNALEAVGDRGTVTVEAGRTDGPGAASIPYLPQGAQGDPWCDTRHFAVVRVADTGPGIDEDDRDRVFQPFFTTKKAGSGVGMAIAKKIVGSHRGTIDVTSAAGEGAEITVRLPMAERTPEG